MAGLDHRQALLVALRRHYPIPSFLRKAAFDDDDVGYFQKKWVSFSRGSRAECKADAPEGLQRPVNGPNR
jgi:hypothetical protein